MNKPPKIFPKDIRYKNSREGLIVNIIIKKKEKQESLYKKSINIH